MSEYNTIALVSAEISKQKERAEELLRLCSLFHLDVLRFCREVDTKHLNEACEDSNDLEAFRDVAKADQNLILIETMIGRLHTACDIINVQSEMGGEWPSDSDMAMGFLVDNSHTNTLFLQISDVFSKVMKHCENAGFEEEDLLPVQDHFKAVSKKFARVRGQGPNINEVELEGRTPLEFLFQRRIDYAEYCTKSTEAVLDYVEQNLQITATLLKDEVDLHLQTDVMLVAASSVSEVKDRLKSVEKFLRQTYDMCPEDMDNKDPKPTENVSVPLIFDVNKITLAF